MSDIPDHAEKVFSGVIFSVWQWEQELYDGSTATFEALTQPDTAFLLGVLPNQKLLMVRDYQPHRDAVIATPGGRMDPGENARGAAMREFREETGYEAEEVIPWFEYKWGSKVHNTSHYFIGKNIQKAAEPEFDAGEKIEPLEYSFDEFLALGSNTDMREMILRLRLLEAQLDKKKREELYNLLYAQ